MPTHQIIFKPNWRTRTIKEEIPRSVDSWYFLVQDYYSGNQKQLRSNLRRTKGGMEFYWIKNAIQWKYRSGLNCEILYTLLLLYTLNKMMYLSLSKLMSFAHSFVLDITLIVFLYDNTVGSPWGRSEKNDFEYSRNVIVIRINNISSGCLVF